MCSETCSGCQICFEDKLAEQYGEEWWNHPSVVASYSEYVMNENDDIMDEIEGEELPF